MKKTKAIITVGPSSKDINVLRELVNNGADVIRINLSHADKTFCDDIIKKIRTLEEEIDRPIGIMLDTDGPSVRLDRFKEEEVYAEVDKQILIIATIMKMLYCNYCKRNYSKNKHYNTYNF